LLKALIMKRIVWWFCLVLLLVPLEACRKLKSLANINVNIPYNTQLTIPAVYDEGLPIPLGGINATVGPVALETRSAQYLEQYNTSPEKILHVKLSKLVLKVLSPANENIDFMDTARIYISANGQPEFLAAYYYGRATGRDSMALTCSDQNLKNYFLADVIYIKLNGRFNRVPAPGTTLGIYSTFNLLANPLY
jgi:hypothetical protein